MCDPSCDAHEMPCTNVVHETKGTPSLRPMVFDFNDKECTDAVDQFMFGPDWLVAPVLEMDAANR